MPPNQIHVWSSIFGQTQLLSFGAIFGLAAYKNTHFFVKRKNILDQSSKLIDMIINNSSVQARSKFDAEMFPSSA